MSRPRTFRPHRMALLLTFVVAGAGLVTGCSSETTADPKTVLSAAKRQLDKASTVHFELTGSDLPDTGVVMVSAEGTAKRPASFDGAFRMATGGVAATIEVISVDGTLYAKLPLSDSFTRTDPDQLSVSDPADLLSPEHGLSSFLTAVKRAKSEGQQRSGEDVVETISGDLPAKLVSRFLYINDQRSRIKTTFSVVAETNELRKASFRGRFYGDRMSTYTIELDRYGEPVRIEAPL